MAALVTDPGRIPGAVFIPGVAAVRLIWTLQSGKQANNVLHAKFSPPLTLTQTIVNNLFAAVTTAFTSSLMANYIHATVQLTALGIRDLSPVPGSSFGYGEWESNITGINGAAAAGVPIPSNVSFVVSLETGLSQQANRGRVYIPGWSSVAEDGTGKILQACAEAAVLFIEDVKTALHNGPPVLDLCIAHPARQAYTGRAGALHPARAADSVPVVSEGYRDLIWDTQRRRVRP